MIERFADSELLREFVEAGSDAAFQELVERNSKLVFATTFRVLGDRQLAEDAAQSAFLLLAQKAYALRERVVVAGWLYATAHRCALNLARERKRRERGEREACMPAKETAQQPPEVEWKEIQPHLDAAIAELPAILRDTLILRCILNRDPAEAAGELKCSGKALSMRLHRALERLRFKLQQRGVSAGSMQLLPLLATHGLESPGAAAVQIQPAAVGKAAALKTSKGTAGLKSLVKCKFTMGMASLLIVSILLIVVALPRLSNALRRQLEDEYARPRRVKMPQTQRQ